MVGEVGDPSEPNVSVPDDLAAIDRVALPIDGSARCSTVGESFDVQISRVLTAADAPESVILRKPVPGGCMYALRLPDYCATGIAKGGTLTFSHNDVGISAVGCELSNRGNQLVIELAAPEG